MKNKMKKEVTVRSVLRTGVILETTESPVLSVDISLAIPALRGGLRVQGQAVLIVMRRAPRKISEFIM